MRLIALCTLETYENFEQIISYYAYMQKLIEMIFWACW